MKNLKNYLPVIVFVVTLVLSGISIVTSQELAKRKYIPPEKIIARGCTPQEIQDGTCPPEYIESIQKGFWQPDYDEQGNIKAYYSTAEHPDPSFREREEVPPPACVPGATNCGSCSVSCGGGTRTCSDGCRNWTESCNTQTCITPSPSSTPTPTVTPTKTPTPTVTPTGTLTPTATPTVTPTGTPLPTLTPTSTPTGTLTPTITPSPTQVAAAHRACVNLTCQVVTGSGPDECQSDVSCQPPPVTPVTPKAATVTPTILSIIGGAGLLLIGILLSL